MARGTRAGNVQNRVGGSRAAVSRGDLWQTRGDRFLRPIRFPGGEVNVEGEQLMREIRDLLGVVAPIASREISRALVPAAEFAFDQWPVSDRDPSRHVLGVHSKELVGLEYRVLDDSTWQASLVNRADYAALIRRGRTARKLIFRRGERAALTASGRIARALGEL